MAVLNPLCGAAVQPCERKLRVGSAGPAEGNTMSSRRHFQPCAFLLVGLALAGCVEGELELEASLDELAEPAAGLADELASNNEATPYNSPTVECSSHNVIGVLDNVRGAHCSMPGAPSLPNWQWHTMFEDFTPDLDAWTETLPLGLRRYCIYEYVGPDEPNPEDYNALFSAINQYLSLIHI